MDRKISMSRTAAPRRRRAASLDKRKAMGGWLFVMPFVIGLLLIYFPVIVDSFKYSLSSMTFDKTQGFVVEFVGLENYQEALFVDPKFVQTLTSGIKNLIIDIPSIVIFSLFIAVILNQKVLYRKHRHSLTVVAVADAPANRNIVSTDTDPIPTGLKKLQSLYQHIPASHDPESIAPFALFVRRLLIVALPHPERRALSATKRYVRNAVELYEIITLMTELTALRDQLHTWLKHEFDVRRHLQRQRVPGSRLSVERDLLRAGGQRFPDEFRGIRRIIPKIRNLDRIWSRLHSRTQHHRQYRQYKNLIVFHILLFPVSL